jgi:hypothetical protein
MSCSSRSTAATKAAGAPLHLIRSSLPDPNSTTLLCARRYKPGSGMYNAGCMHHICRPFSRSTP